MTLNTSALLAIALTIFTPALSQASQAVYLTWEKVPTARAYQLLLSTNRRFKKGSTEIMSLKEPFGELTINDKYKRGKRYAKIRAIFSKKNVGAWFPIRFTKFKKIKLPERVSVPYRLQGKYRLKWNAPKGRFKNESHLYRVRLERFEDQQLIYEIVEERQSFTLPKLPGGNYSFTVEALGAPDVGTLAIESNIISGTTIEVDAIPYDPKNPKAIPQSMVLSSSRFFPSFRLKLLNESQFMTNDGYNNAIQGLITMAFNFDLSINIELPIILTADEGPRLGGGPNFPATHISYRFWGDDRRYFAGGFGGIWPINSQGQDFIDSQFSSILLANFTSRWSFDRIVADASLFSGLKTAKGFSGGATSAVAPVLSTEVRVGYSLLDEKFLPAATLGFLHLGQIDVINSNNQSFTMQESINSGSIGLRADYLLFRSLALNAVLKINITSAQIPSVFSLGGTLIF